MKLVANFRKYISVTGLLLFNTLFFVFAAKYLPLLFETVDDSYMCIIANGVFSGQPDAHLVFVNALYGSFLVVLYNLFQSVEWYTVLYCVFHILAMTGIVVMIWNDYSIRQKLKIPFIFFLYFIWVHFILNFQFTTTAGLLCFSGCLALCRNEAESRVAGTAAIFIASLVRFEAAALMGILLIPVLVLRLIEDRKYIFWFAALAILVISGKMADKMYYKSPEWQEYLTYNESRSRIQDDPNRNQIRPIELPDNVSEEDYLLFIHFIGDPKIMNQSVLDHILSQYEKPVASQILQTTFSQMLQVIVPLLLLVSLFGTCLLFFIINHKRTKNQKAVYVLISTFLLFISIFCYLSATTFFKMRVFLCMLLPMMYVIVKSLPVEDAIYVLIRNATVSLAVFISIFALYYLRRDYFVWKDRHDRWITVSNKQMPLLETYDDLVYAPNFAFYNPFTLKDTPYTVLRLGWMCTMPIFKERFDSYPDFVNKGIICLNEVDSPPDYIRKNLMENYGIEANFVVLEQNDVYAVYLLIQSD